MAQIHPTAVVEPGAQLADDVIVGPLCHVGGQAVLGSGTRLISHVTVLGRTILGQGNTVWPHAVLGADPQDLKFRGEKTSLKIGDHNQIRESVTVHLGTANGGGVTRIGSENLIMVGAHVAHDCQIGDHIIIANAVQLAGHIRIHDHAILSGASAVHHYVTIGSYAMVGGMTRIVHDVPPFMIVEGNPSRVRGVNIIGLNRHRFAQEHIDHLKTAYRTLFRNGDDQPHEEAAASMVEGLASLEQRFGDDECIRLLVQFLRNSAVGLHGRHLESLRHDQRHHNPVK